MLTTCYYRTLAPTPALGCSEEPDVNYTPYDVFRIETRFYPILFKTLGREVEIIFKTILDKDRMNLVLSIQNKEGQIDLSEINKDYLQTELDKIIVENPAYCLIDRKELYLTSERTYPFRWFYNVLEYVNLTTEYNPFVKDEGIYVAFNPKADYKSAYNNLCVEILNILKKYYQDGVVFGAEFISVPWRLERLDQDQVKAKLFKPLWKDHRFAPNLSLFLMDRMEGNKYIRVKVSPNLARGHNVVSNLVKNGYVFSMDGDYVKILVEDLDEAQKVCSLITWAENDAEGKVVTKSLLSIELAQQYIKHANELLGNPDCVGYQTSDPLNPFRFSCSIPNNLSVKLVLEQLDQNKVKP